ncbi:hypothetical protein DRQ18_05245 [bacterium]|nr:MAG: hypothetical protein DRQ18_05245 [bacterium]
MKIKTLSLKRFRNFKEMEIEFGDGLTLVLGKNGVGKTNLLEAIHYLGTLRSFRRAKEKDMVSFGEEFFEVKGKTDGLEIKVLWMAGKKNIELDGKRIKKVEDAFGKLLTVAFTSHDLFLIDGPPQERRRFFDMLLSKIDISYLSDLIAYRKVLKQRNALLSREEIKEEEMNIWDEQLIPLGERIVQKRRELLKDFREKVKNFFEVLSGKKLEIIYNPTFDPDKGMRGELLARREAERIYHTTLTGPHRDNYIFLVDGKDAKKFSSLGERRALAFALRLSEAETIREKRDEYPVLLLDEVIGELDRTRVYNTLKLVLSYPQTFLATAREEVLSTEGVNVIRIDTEDGTPVIERSY